MTRNLVIATLGMLGLAACGQPAAGPVPGAAEPQTAPSSSPNGTRASQAEVKCLGSNCHPSVGLITVVDGNEVRGCTGFLVAPDLVATAGSCLSDELQRATSCRGRLWMAFPRMQGFPAQTLDCLNVVDSAVPNLQGEGPDYAFIRIAAPSVPRPSVQISRQGFPDRQSMALIRVDMATRASDGHINASLRRQGCVVVQRSYYLPEFDSDLRGLVSLSNCAEGISGAGGLILTADGSPKAVGILTGTLQLPIRERSRLAGQNLFAGEPEKLTSAASLSCIPLPPELSADFPISSVAACGAQQRQHSLDVPLLPNDATLLALKLKSSLSEWRIGHALSDRTFGWEIDVKTSSDDVLRDTLGVRTDQLAVAHAIPNCVQDSTALDRRRTLQMPAWTYPIYLNSYLQKRVKMDSVGAPQISGAETITLKAASSLISDRYELELSVPDPLNTLFVSYKKISIPRCH